MAAPSIVGMSLAIKVLNDGFDCLVAVDKGPGRDRPVRAAHAHAGVAAQIVDEFRRAASSDSRGYTTTVRGCDRVSGTAIISAR